MTTYIDFNPQPNVAFQFNATFDGNQYVVTCTWNLYRGGATPSGVHGYYVNVTDLLGNLVVALPLIGSPLTYDINMIAGYFFVSSLVFRPVTGQFEISP